MRTNLLAGLLLLAPLAARAGGPQLSTVAVAALDEGLARLYGMDYEESRRVMRGLIAVEPDNPFAYLFESGAIWWQASQEYGLFQSTPTLQGLFEQDIEAALRKAEPLMDSDDRATKADGYFVSGMALGTRGQWNLMKRRYLDAYFDGRKAIKHLKKCVKLDPEYRDAHLGLGIFDYQAAHLSGVAKLGALFGLKGDEPRGLALIADAMHNGRLARRQAAQFLSSIYIIDKRDWAKALPVIESLREDFPDSSYFLFLEVLLRHRLGDWDGSLKAGRQLHARIAADPVAFRPKWLTIACGLSGADCLAQEDLERTVSWLDHALSHSTTEKHTTFCTMAMLLRAHALDAMGRREEAVVAYQKAEFMPPLGDSRERARRCLAEPCTREVLLKDLRALAKTP
jgi:tetratricopeptide (TPR) repeat protein